MRQEQPQLTQTINHTQCGRHQMPLQEPFADRGRKQAVRMAIRQTGAAHVLKFK